MNIVQTTSTSSALAASFKTEAIRLTVARELLFILLYKVLDMKSVIMCKSVGILIPNIDLNLVHLRKSTW